MTRSAEASRKTKETDIKLKLCLDGGDIAVDTGIGFFDHVLNSLAFHAGWGMELTVRGDLHVDAHHTVEDTGIVIGQALSKILGDKSGIARFGQANIPMDEALSFCAVDISGRPFLVYNGDISGASGGYDFCLNEEFFRAFAYNAGITLHLSALYGKNGHHMTEALFKACARALKAALEPSDKGFASTKGML